MKVSIVIANWNGRDLLRKNLPHVLSQSHPDYEVIVVDNGSKDDSVRLLREEFPRVRTVELPENRGFTGGNNAALPHARGEFIATLNNDARPERDWLDRLVEAAAPEDVGICASRLLVDGTGVIDSAGDSYLTTMAARKRGTAAEPLFSACAGAALYRRRMIDEIGFFDDDFFLIYEDVDLCFRARLRGWRVVYAPEAVVHHQVSHTLHQVPDLHAYYQYRNTEFVWVRNVPARLILRHAPAAALGRLLEAWEAARKLRGRYPLYWRAKLHVLLALPRLLAARRRLQSTRSVSPDSIEAAMQGIPRDRLAFWGAEIRRALRW